MEQALDKGFHAAQAGFTGGLSPIALAETYSDWALYLTSALGKQLELAEKAGKKAWKFANYAATCALHSNANANANANDACIEPLPQDKRFSGEAWQKWPLNVMSQAFLLNQQWWDNATTGVEGSRASTRTPPPLRRARCSMSSRLPTLRRPIPRFWPRHSARVART
jgi:polyhydroxyalkanoate synthase